MAIDWSAFAGGVAKSYANNIDERAKDERDFKMREKLVALEDKYKQEAEARAEARAKRKVDDKLSYPDYDTGEMVFTNEDGAELSRRKMTSAQIASFGLEQRKEQAGLDNILSTISARSADTARSDKVAGAQIGSYNRSNRDGPSDKLADKNRARVENVLSSIDGRLGDIGAPPAERIRVREAVLKRVAAGKPINQSWLDNYESALLGDYQSKGSLDVWGAEQIKRERAKAAAEAAAKN